MKNIITIVTFVILTISLGIFYRIVIQTPCGRVIEYDIGNFDERFKINKDQVIDVIKRAEIPWEDVAGKNIFKYVPGADFKVNLIFGEQQEKLYKGQNLENTLNSREEIINSNKDRYNLALKRYSNALSKYESQLKKYEQDVNYWNSHGGAPTAEYNKLQSEARSLDSKVKEINKLQDLVNKIANESNINVNKYNNDINKYNNLFESGKEFDAGDTDGMGINVYSYSDLSELHVLLIHEFGHVLGVEHINDPTSVMYYLLNNENTSGKISENDANALKEICKLK